MQSQNSENVYTLMCGILKHKQYMQSDGHEKKRHKSLCLQMLDQKEIQCKIFWNKKNRKEKEKKINIKKSKKNKK